MESNEIIRNELKKILLAYNVFVLEKEDLSLVLIELSTPDITIEIYDKNGEKLITAKENTVMLRGSKSNYLLVWCSCKLTLNEMFQLTSLKRKTVKFSGMKFVRDQVRYVSSKIDLLSFLGKIISNIKDQNTQIAKFLRSIPKKENYPKLNVTNNGNKNKKTPLLSLIIPVYKNFDYLEIQLNNLENNSWFTENGEIIYINDCPWDELNFERFIVSTLLPSRIHAKFYSNSQNLGFSGANNQAVIFSRGSVLCFANSDLVFPSSFNFELLIATLKCDKNIGLVTCPMIDQFGAIQHIWMEEFRNQNNFWENCHPNSGLFLDDILKNEPDIKEIELTSGALVFLEKSLFNKIKGWDEDFIVGDFEDNILSHAVKKHGKKLVSLLTQSVVHLEGKSFARDEFKHRVNSIIYDQKRESIIGNE